MYIGPFELLIMMILFFVNVPHGLKKIEPIHMCGKNSDVINRTNSETSTTVTIVYNYNY